MIPIIGLIVAAYTIPRLVSLGARSSEIAYKGREAPRRSRRQ